ncbi:MAG: GNAT family N-acetyltransferase [Gulosibacter sp.]|uniref:GNAT family N-acetyltransferase n=1 Tax=Gulosibacter sp. TaxID=2817531 RepID=UPI003F90518F
MTITTTATERFEILDPKDARLTPVLEDLVREYDARYGDLEGHDAKAEVYDGTADRFLPEHGGAFIALMDGDTAIATGGIRQYDERTAEFKKIWSHPERRGQRLASRMLEKLESTAFEMGYERVYLTTGPRQPEADRLYERQGYTPHFDPEAFTAHAYVKALIPEADASKLPTSSIAQLFEFNGVAEHN